MKQTTNKKTGFKPKSLGRRKRIALLGVIVIIIVISVSLELVTYGSESSSQEYDSAKASNVNMVQTLTAAGEITTGKTTTISFSTSKVFKSMCVEENQG